MSDYPKFNLNWSEAVIVAWLNNYRHDPSEAPNIERIQPESPMSFANYPIKDKPAAPADDEVTVNWLASLIGWDDDEGKRHVISVASEAVAEIRRGEVPGLTTTAEAQDALTAAHAWADAEIKRLHVERDALKAEVERLKQQYCVPGTITLYANASEMTFSGVEIKYRGGTNFDVINHPAIALQAEVERLRAELQQERLALTDMRAEYVRRCDQRDAAIARAENLQCVFDDYAKHTDRAQKTIKGGLGKNYLEAALDAMDTSRAAHAEAMSVVRRAYIIISLNKASGECEEWIESANEYLTKHQNKDASK